MAWKCPVCGETNDDSLIRCVCGYEDVPNDQANSRQNKNKKPILFWIQGITGCLWALFVSCSLAYGSHGSFLGLIYSIILGLILVIPNISLMRMKKWPIVYFCFIFVLYIYLAFSLKSACSLSIMEKTFHITVANSPFSKYFFPIVTFTSVSLVPANLACLIPFSFVWKMIGSIIIILWFCYSFITNWDKLKSGI